MVNFKKVLDIDAFSWDSFCLLVPSVISGLAVYASNTTLASSNISNVLRVLMYLFSILIIYNCLKQKQRASYAFPIFGVAMLYWFIGLWGNNPSWAPLYVLLMLGIAFSSDGIKCDAFRLYVDCLVVMSILGIIAILSFLVLHILPYNIVNFYEDTTDTYFNFGIAYLFVDSQDGFRLCGLFNEPGYFGTFLSLALIAENLNFRKIKVWIMFVAGCLTFSLAFYLTLIIFIIIRKVKNPFYILIIAVFIYVFFKILPTLSFDNRMLDVLVQRMNISDGELAGNNRDKVNYSLLFSHFNLSSDVFFGRGIGSTRDLGVSFLMMIIQIGYVGALLTYGSLAIVSWKLARKYWQLIVFFLCFWINVYQRTNIFSINYFLLLFGGMLYMGKNIKNNNPITQNE